MKNILIILCGIPFSGKTYFAKKIAKDLHAVRIDLDEIKFELYGENAQDSQLTQKDWDTIYQVMYKRIEKLLRDGRSVIHDTGNFTAYERRLIQDIAKKLSVPSVTVFIDTPVEVAQKRLIRNRQTKERFNVSDTSFQVAVDEMEPPTKDENPVRIDGRDNYAQLIHEIKQVLELYK